jgi:class II aldolase/adducin N-terminal domain-containing protein
VKEQEGVTKYSLQHTLKPLTKTIDLTALNAWRQVFLLLQMIGQDPQRYQGLGFGNLSVRTDENRFLISGTQTGHLPVLRLADCAIVDQADPFQNHIVSHGQTSPSSEALTHAVLYQLSLDINAIIHVHCPPLWRNSRQLNLPYISESISYGTPEMAKAVAELYSSGDMIAFPIFSMLGHEDGIVVFGSDLKQAAHLLIEQFVLALAINV